MVWLKRAKRTLRCGLIAALPMLSVAQVPIPRMTARPAAPAAPKLVKAKPAEWKAGPVEKVAIPGPLRSFLRMAGVSQQVSAEDVLPSVAWVVYQNGYQGETPTESLTLMQRYLAQARELQAMAQPSHTIRVASCAGAEPLLKILGYEVERCNSPEARLHTSDPDRAFVTTDSGFPITDLEEALASNVPFVYSYPDAVVPVLYGRAEWIKLSEGRARRSGDLLDALLGDPAVARLYRAMSRMDPETGYDLERGVGLRALLPYRSLLDFYGSQVSVRGGKVLVPGGVNAEVAWKSLVGVSPETPGPFLSRLLARDDGWMSAYYDALSRVSKVQQEHLTDPSRLQHFYAAFHAADGRERAGAGSYSRASELLVLDTRLMWDATGQPYVPGSLEAWHHILQARAPAGKTQAMTKAGGFSSGDQLIESVIASSREEREGGPLPLYLTLSEIDRRRGPGRGVSAETVKLVARRYQDFNNWMLLFSEFPELNDASIQRFLEVGESVDHAHGDLLRANALGSLQASLGLWQILARQKEIPEAGINSSFLAVLEPFARVNSSTELFDSTRRSLNNLLAAAAEVPGTSPNSIVELLAGPAQATDEGKRVHGKLVSRMDAVLEDQQLVSLGTLYSIADELAKLEQGSKDTAQLVALMPELRGFELPPALFTRGEKTTFAPGVYTTRHAELHVRGELTELTKTPATRAQLQAARGQLAGFLRDTLVGLNYAYYEPPGAQILHINPLFVRAHDFLGVSFIQDGSVWRSPRLVGAGVSAGGGAYLMGSLVDLPFALASAEQNFIVPENIEALIWRQIVPNLVVAATLPRWWDVTPGQMHAVALWQRMGEELVVEAAKDPATRARVEGLLAHQLSPRNLQELRTAMESDAAVQAYLPSMMATDLLYLAQNYRAVYPADGWSAGPAGRELAELARTAPGDVDAGQISTRFGVPHPVLARSNGLELLNLEPFPSYSGGASRLLGESLESSNLYWTRLADELGYPPAMLHLLIPELTRVMIGKIFASDVEDWPAVQRAMHATGDDFRAGRIAAFQRAPSSRDPALSTTGQVLKQAGDQE